MLKLGMAVVLVVGVAYMLFRYTGLSDRGKIESGSARSTPSAVQQSPTFRITESRAGQATISSLPAYKSPLQSQPPTSRDWFAAMLTDSAEDKNVELNVAKNMHKKFAAEPVDPNWSANVEVNMKNFFDGQSSAKNADIVNMECHTSICEILAVGKAAETTEQTVDQWQTTVYASPRQNWWADFGLRDITTSTMVNQDGRVLFATYLMTKPVQVQSTTQ